MLTILKCPRHRSTNLVKINISWKPRHLSIKKTNKPVFKIINTPQIYCLRMIFCSEFSLMKKSILLLSHLWSHFPVSVVEHMTKTQKGRVYLTCNSKNSPSVQGSWGIRKVAGHVAFEIRKKRAMNTHCCSFPSIHIAQDSSQGMVPSEVRGLTSVNATKIVPVLKG